MRVWDAFIHLIFHSTVLFTYSVRSASIAWVSTSKRKHFVLLDHVKMWKCDEWHDIDRNANTITLNFERRMLKYHSMPLHYHCCCVIRLKISKFKKFCCKVTHKRRTTRQIIITKFLWNLQLLRNRKLLWLEWRALHSTVYWEHGISSQNNYLPENWEDLFPSNRSMRHRRSHKRNTDIIAGNNNILMTYICSNWSLYGWMSHANGTFCSANVFRA